MGGAAIVRVGLVGGNAQAGWARVSHVPALARLRDVRLSAVATTRRESATQAAEAFGAEHAFTSAAELAGCPDVDLVAVSVKAPMHFDTAMAAIRAGKHVFCEWPMGANLEQSVALARAAEQAGVRSFVGLQARVAPAAVHARQLIREGYLGRLYAASMWGAVSYWGDPIASAYSADVNNGANVLTIPGGHGIDAMCFVLDDQIDRLSGWQTLRRSQVWAADADARVPITAPDQFATAGTLVSGALFTAHFTGTAPHGEIWRLHLSGDRGELLLETDGMPEIAPMRLSGTCDRGRRMEPVAVAQSALDLPAGPALNVGLAWSAIARDLREGSHTTPDFAEGARSRASLEAIAQSDRSGQVPVVVAGRSEEG